MSGVERMKGSGQRDFNWLSLHFGGRWALVCVWIFWSIRDFQQEGWKLSDEQSEGDERDLIVAFEVLIKK